MQELHQSVPLGLSRPLLEDLWAASTTPIFSVTAAAWPPANSTYVRTANPDAKATSDIHDIKVRISGDTATVTYAGTYTATGFKDPNANVPGANFVTIDTWQKRSGKWKVIAGAAVSTEPIPAEAYMMPAPGASN